MEETQKHFSLAEAESLLPRVRELISEARMFKLRLEKKVAAWEEMLVGPNGHRAHASPADEVMMKGHVQFLMGEINERLAQITQFGAIPKDLDAGLVDFPTRVNGEEAYLCWRIGEAHIEHWHDLDEGYSGRKPLPQNLPLQ